MSYYGFFNDTAYRVVDGNIVYAGDINNPLAALETGISSLVDSIQTGAVVKTATDTGALNAYVVNLTAAPATLVDGLEVWLKPAASNTGPATINVNSLGATAIRTTSQTALIGGELLINQWFLLKYSSAVSAFIIVSDPGITNYVGGDTLISGDGIGISTVGDEITIEVADGEITTEKIANAAVTVAKILNIDKIADRTIIGFSLFTGESPSHIGVGSGKCWDSTGTVYLEMGSSTSVSGDGYNAGTLSAGDLVLIYVVRLVSNGTVVVKAYLETDPQADEDVTVDAWRLIDFWNVSTPGWWDEGLSSGGLHMFGKASEKILSSGIGATYATVNHELPLLPLPFPRFRALGMELVGIEYGVRDGATAGSILASYDGTNTAFTIGLTITTASNTTATAWGDTTSGRQGLVPYDPQIRFKASTGTLDLLVHQVLLRR